MKRIIAVLAVLLLFGCAAQAQIGSTSISVGDSSPAGADSSLLSQGILKFTLADLEAAATYATTNGYPARAAVYRAHAAHLTAVTAQVRACKDAIAAALPKPVQPGTAGAFLLFEMAAEKVGQGISPQVRINCGAITLP
jgi:hypothetical protein